MMTNCIEFHYFARSATYSQAISYQMIILADFVKYKPAVRVDCLGMWSRVNVCVRSIGITPTILPRATVVPTIINSTGNGAVSRTPN